MVHANVTKGLREQLALLVLLIIMPIHLAHIAREKLIAPVMEHAVPMTRCANATLAGLDLIAILATQTFSGHRVCIVQEKQIAVVTALARKEQMMGLSVNATLALLMQNVLLVIPIIMALTAHIVRVILIVAVMETVYKMPLVAVMEGIPDPIVLVAARTMWVIPCVHIVREN